MEYQGVCRRVLSRLLLFIATLCMVGAAAASDERDLQAAQVRALLEQGDPGVLLDALAADTGVPRTGRAYLREQFALQRFNTARVYVHDDAVHVRLDLSPEGLGWLTLRHERSNDRVGLAGWRDHALGASLASLAGSVETLSGDEAGAAFLAHLPEDPMTAWRDLPRARRDAGAARLLLMACAHTGCRDDALVILDEHTDAAARKDSPALWELDVAVLGRDWQRFRDVRQALYEQLGPDPALALIEARAARARSGCEAVLPVAEPAQARWPGYAPLYPLLAECQVVAGNPAAALALFEQMSQRFGTQIDWAAMARHPVYSDLVNSETYRQWQAERDH